MHRLHSISTFFWKYIFPSVSLLIILFYLVVAIKNEDWILSVIIFSVAIILVGIIKNFYSKLKLVYLDEVNSRIIIKGKKDDIIFFIDQIKKIDKIKILNVLLIIHFELENEVVFVPKNSSFFFGKTTENKLKNLTINR